MELFARLLVPFTFLTFSCMCHNENSCESLDKKCFRVVALIPARAGSKGIKNKNLSIIGNETLLSRTLRIAQQSGIFESVWVSTDGENIANEAKKQGVNIHWRNPQTATDNASTISAVEDFLLNRRGINFHYDVIAIVQCTSPFLQEKFLRNALNIMLSGSVDCVFSATRSFQLRWNEHSDGLVFPINFNPMKRPRRQDWKGELVENGMFYFLKPELILRDKVLQNNRCKTLQIPKQFSLEIDTETDLFLARNMLPLLNT